MRTTSKIKWWYFVPVVPIALLLFGRKAKAQASGRPKLGPAQQRIADAVSAEAVRQGVDPRIALAYTEIESNFKSVTNGVSYGPLQVNAKYYKGPANDLLGPAGIVEGIKILKHYLEAAGGDPELGRVMYLCGIAGSKDPAKCSEATKARVRARWQAISPKWGL